AQGKSRIAPVAQIQTPSSKIQKMPNAKWKTLKAASLIVAFCGMALAVWAQPEPEKKSGSRPPEKEQPGQRPLPGPAMAGRFGPGIERLFSVLTEEQRASLRESMEGQRDKMRELEEKARDARREIFEMGLKKDFYEDAVRKKA